MKKELSQKQGGGGSNAIEKRNIIIGVANLSEPAQKKPEPLPLTNELSWATFNQEYESY